MVDWNRACRVALALDEHEREHSLVTWTAVVVRMRAVQCVWVAGPPFARTSDTRRHCPCAAGRIVRLRCGGQRRARAAVAAPRPRSQGARLAAVRPLLPRCVRVQRVRRDHLGRQPAADPPVRPVCARRSAGQVRRALPFPFVVTIWQVSLAVGQQLLVRRADFVVSPSCCSPIPPAAAHSSHVCSYGAEVTLLFVTMLMIVGRLKLHVSAAATRGESSRSRGSAAEALGPSISDGSAAQRHRVFLASLLLLYVIMSLGMCSLFIGHCCRSRVRSEDGQFLRAGCASVGGPLQKRVPNLQNRSTTQLTECLKRRTSPARPKIFARSLACCSYR
jgi:hypothetical protein